MSHKARADVAGCACHQRLAARRRLNAALRGRHGAHETTATAACKARRPRSVAHVAQPSSPALCCLPRMAQGLPTWSSRLIALLERGLPPPLLEDHERRRRALLIEGTAWLVVLACALTVPVILGTTRGLGRITSLAADLGT